MKRIFRPTFLILILFCWNVSRAQTREEIAPTPPMGWNSWNCFRIEINEENIKAVADAMVNSGMKDAGYEYVILDDGWMSNERDEDGHIVVDKEKFPNGMKALGEYIHGLGLKFGIYSAPGKYTCQKLMGSYGYEQMDADDYADWGVDYLKYDWCAYPSNMEAAKELTVPECRAAFELMGECLKNTGRPILYSVHVQCVGWGTEGDSYPWVVDVAHMHRSGDDIKDNWDRMLYCLESTADKWEYAGPGFWNDPDMLEVGNTTKERLWGNISDVKMTLLEYRSHFSMWCMVAAPLIAGNDLRTMSDEIVEILTNKEVIAINQDPLGKQGRRIRDDGDLEVWCKELSGNRRVVALFNRSGESADISVSWDEIGMKGKCNVRDLWKHKDLGKYKNGFTGKNIVSHDAVILLIE